MEISFIILQIFKSWWWLIFPTIFFFTAQFLYLWWVRWEVWYPKHNWIMLKIKPPEEILKPFRAMEDVYNLLWGVYDNANWRERWCEGQLPKAPHWISFEIASIGGKVNFYLRILEPWRDMVESTIYSHYPEVEISVVEDYTQNVPQDIPNKEWDMHGEDFTIMKDDVYPIKTYSTFFEERPEVVKEEKRIDPMNSLLEALAKLQPGEQIWLQIVAAPILDADDLWRKRGLALASKLAKRPSEKKPKSILQEAAQEAAEILITGKPAEKPKEEVGLIAPELRMTPGEKEILKGVETKIQKHGYKTWIRIVYVYKKHEPHFGGNYKIGRTYFNHFMSQHLNLICFMGPTRTKIHYWLKKRRLFLRKRKQFRNYVDRLPALFPRSFVAEPMFPFGFATRGPGRGKGTFILNTEELATIYHFPSKITVPSVPRVEAKKGGPPSKLPTK